MNQQKETMRVGKTEFSVFVSVVLCLFACAAMEKLGFSIQTLAACTGAVMCTQDTQKASWNAGWNRILGVICGGIAGVAVVAADNAIRIDGVFYILVGLGVLLNFMLCKMVKLPFVQARVSCMSLMLVTLVLQGTMRYQYALGRLIGTLFGAVISLVVSMMFAKIKEN